MLTCVWGTNVKGTSVLEPHRIYTRTIKYIVLHIHTFIYIQTHFIKRKITVDETYFQSDFFYYFFFCRKKK